MAKKKIIFQGEPGANSDLACREAYSDYQPIPCPTFEDCFAALSAGDVDLGMIPIENSIAGAERGKAILEGRAGNRLVVRIGFTAGEIGIRARFALEDDLFLGHTLCPLRDGFHYPVCASLSWPGLSRPSRLVGH